MSLSGGKHGHEVFAIGTFILFNLNEKQTAVFRLTSKPMYYLSIAIWVSFGQWFVR